MGHFHVPPISAGAGNGFRAIHTLLLCSRPDAPAVLNLIEEFSPHWGGTCMVGVASTRDPSPGRGWGMQGHHSRPESGWIRHAWRFFPRCLASENICSDMDERVWPSPRDRADFRIVAFLSKEVVLWFTVYVISLMCSVIPLISVVFMSACSTTMRHATRPLKLHEQQWNRVWTLACLIFVFSFEK